MTNSYQLSSIMPRFFFLNSNRLVPVVQIFQEPLCIHDLVDLEVRVNQKSTQIIDLALSDNYFYV